MPHADQMTPREYSRMQAEAALHGYTLEQIETPNWVTFALQHKEMITDRAPDTPAAPPALMAVIHDEPCAFVIAPQVDKMLGLKAANTLHVGLDPDELFLCFDVFFQRDMGALQPGQLQRLRESGFQCELNPIRDAMIAFRVLRGGAWEAARLPYVPPAGRKPLAWAHKDFAWTGQHACGDVRELQMGGGLVDALREIRQQPATLDREEYRELAALAGQLEYSRERQRWHMGRAALLALHRLDYLVVDMLTERHPEWYEPGTEPIGVPDDAQSENGPA